MPSRAAFSALALAATLACQPRPDANTGEPNAGGSAAHSDTSGSAMTTDVQLTLDRATYPAGAPVTIRIANRTQRQLGYNACTRIVEREAGGSWSDVPEPDRICTMELRLLDGGATVSEQTELPAPLQAGRYRLALNMSDESRTDGAPLRAVSAPFDVR